MTVSITSQSANTSDLLTLARWMAGDFSNQKQAFANSKQDTDIHVFFCPLPFDLFSGIGLNFEQVYDDDLWAPYRQGVPRLVDKGDRIDIENYRLSNPVQYVGAARVLDIFNSTTSDGITWWHCCLMVFKRDDEIFLGNVEPGSKCLITRNGRQTYTVSEVTLTENTWGSLDKGIDVETHELRWGSPAEPLGFEKKQSFANSGSAVSELC